MNRGVEKAAEDDSVNLKRLTWMVAKAQKRRKYPKKFLYHFDIVYSGIRKICESCMNHGAGSGKVWSLDI